MQTINTQAVIRFAQITKDENKWLYNCLNDELDLSGLFESFESNSQADMQIEVLKLKIQWLRLWAAAFDDSQISDDTQEELRQEFEATEARGINSEFGL